MSEEMRLIETLKETYPSEIIQPYGEVLIIPRKAFQNSWTKTLQTLGAKIYAQSFRSEQVFFIKLRQNGEGNVENQTEKKQEKPRYKRHRRKWSDQDLELLREMNSQGFLTSEIGEKLGRTKNAIRFKKRDLGLTNEYAEPEEESEANPQPTLQNDGIIREYLQCAGELYPRFPHVCSLLLKSASNKISEREGEKQST